MSNGQASTEIHALTYTWSFCKANMKRVFCLSIVLRISITSTLLKGQINDLPAFDMPRAGASFAERRSNADWNWASGLLATARDREVIAQASSDSSSERRFFRLNMTPLTLLISSIIRNRSFGPSQTSLRYLTTLLQSSSIATILAVRLRGSAIV